MTHLDFYQLAPEIDETTEWYLKEIIYCLIKYVGLNEEGAYDAVVTSDYLRRLLANEPLFLRTETAFYWAMHLSKEALWWHDEKRAAQSREYMQERHHPPRGDK